MPPKKNKKTKEEPETSLTVPSSSSMSTTRPKRKCSLRVPTVVDDDDSDAPMSDDEAPVNAESQKKVAKRKTNVVASHEPDNDEPRPSTSGQAQAQVQGSNRKRASGKKPEMNGKGRVPASKSVKTTKIQKSKEEEPANNNELVLPVTSQRRTAGVTNVNLLDALFSFTSKCSCYEVQKRSRAAVADQVTVGSLMKILTDRSY